MVVSQMSTRRPRKRQLSKAVRLQVKSRPRTLRLPRGLRPAAPSPHPPSQPPHSCPDPGVSLTGLGQLQASSKATAQATFFPLCSFMLLCLLGQQRSSQFPFRHHVRGDSTADDSAGTWADDGVPQKPKTTGLRLGQEGGSSGCSLDPGQKGSCFKRQPSLPLGRLAWRGHQGLAKATCPPPAPVQGRGEPAVGRGD